MDLSNGIQILASIPQVTVLIWGLALGHGLYAVVTSTAVQWLGVALLSWLALRRVAPAAGWPTIRIRGLQPGWLRFSAVLQVSTILGLTQLQVDKLLIALWIGLVSVSEFELGFRVANGIQSLPLLALGPLLPVFAELHAGGRTEESRNLLRKGTVNLNGWAFGIAACSIPVAPFLVRAWVGPNHREAEILAAWLLAAYLLNLCTGVASAAVRGAGRPGLEIAPLAAGLALHLVASRLLLGHMGPVGAGPATLVAVALWALLFFIRVSSWSSLRFLDFAFYTLARPAIAFLPVFGLAILAVNQWPPVLLESRMAMVAAAFLTAAAAAGLYMLSWKMLGRWSWTPFWRTAGS
jgi:O-antigen/teichoic acid export membrane protein